jgi:hypothetical protein
MSKILGLALIIASVYFLDQNITFTTHYYYSWWQKIPAAASVLTLLAGICSLTFWRQTVGNFGWILVAVGIVLVFVNSGVRLQPTSLWTFCVAMFAFASGYQLISKGRIRF